jgi:L-alanine-DL-glutamate epimerase-like enolase superfamily enzyme
LMAGGAGEVCDEIRSRARQGYRTVKLKMGAMSVDTDAERLSAAVRVCSELRMRLRVDANRAWTFAEAIHVFKGIDCECIEFVEEPLSRPDTRELCRLRDEMSVPIALDESLEGSEGTRRFAESGAMNTAVVKPARFGGLRASLAAAAVAAESSVRTVFTDSIETEVGMAAVAHVAAAYRASRESEPAAALGLGGLLFLAEKSVAPPVVGLTASGPGLGVERTCGEL